MRRRTNDIEAATRSSKTWFMRVRLRAELDAEEDRRGDVEGELLESRGRRGTVRRRRTTPCEAALDHRVHALEVRRAAPGA